MLRNCLLYLGICCFFASSVTAQSLTNEDWIMDNIFLEDDDKMTERIIILVENGQL